MRCSGCDRELAAAFPGATVHCVCGVRVAFPSSERASVMPVGGGPYRASSIRAPEPGLELVCPYCGNRCAGTLRVCPRCDVRFDSIRCVRCFALQPPGSFACACCGTALELEPLLDPTDAPCPRCKLPLEAAATTDAERTHECPRCGGMFVPRDALAELLARAERAGPFVGGAGARVIPALEEVRYLPCPQCHAQMNRTNFGKVSGVIVDVCRVHGTWFDGGELTRAVAFAASGGLVKARRREEEEKKALAVAKRQAAFDGAAITQGRYEAEEQLEAWRTFLRELFYW